MKPTEHRPYPDPAHRGRRGPKRCPQIKAAVRSIAVVVADELAQE
jgi:hypothetical protein